MIEQSIFQNSSDFDVIINTVKKLFVCSYGRITEVISDKEVLVTENASYNGTVHSYRSVFISFSSLCFESFVKPVVGDLVLILSPRLWAKDLFTAKETSGERSFTGYTEGLTIALGLSTIKNNSITRIAVDEENITLSIGTATINDKGEEEKHTTNVTTSITGNVACTIGDEDNISTLGISVVGNSTLNIGNDDNESNYDITVTGSSTENVTKDKTVAAEGKVVVNGETLELNGSGNNLVKWTELNQALSDFLMKLQISLTTTPISGQGATVPSWVNFPTSIDISGAKCDTLKTDG